MASTAEPELGTAQPQLVSLSSLSPLSGLFTFLPERGISEKTVQNKSLKVYKVRLKTCARRPFLIKKQTNKQKIDNDVDDVVGGLRGGGIRVLVCADTGSETPLGVRQYFL